MQLYNINTHIRNLIQIIITIFINNIGMFFVISCKFYGFILLRFRTLKMNRRPAKQPRLVENIYNDDVEYGTDSDYEIGSESETESDNDENVAPLAVLVSIILLTLKLQERGQTHLLSSYAECHAIPFTGMAGIKVNIEGNQPILFFTI